jgi:transglutaminase-like putative cysteine protease
MKYPLFLWPVLLLLLAARPGIAQRTALMKFGDVPAETFAWQVYAPDSTANAVVLFDKGDVKFEGSNDPEYGFDVIYERHCRIRLLNKNAFPLATMALSLYKKGRRSMTLENLEAATYNLEDGNVVRTKADKSNIFKEENGDFSQEKIVFPNVKEGSVIEYTYRVQYPGFSFLPGWAFQGDYPVVWSEYEVAIPALLNYVMQSHGYIPLTTDSAWDSRGSYNIAIQGAAFGGYRGTWEGNLVHRLWGIKDIPVIAKREPFISSLGNYISRIDFQLLSITTQGYEKTYRNTWPALADELLKRDNFGAPLGDHNRWMDGELGKIAGPDKNSLAAARRIYYYVRDHFNSTNVEGLFLTQTLKKVWEDKKGSVADINLLLTALCQHAGIDAAPVILSSRAHGIAYDAYPLLKDYNYVICRIQVGDRYYLLDASKDTPAFGQLPDFCYNGAGRAINAQADAVVLSPDSLVERRSTRVVLANSDTAGYSGSFRHTAGIYESMELRARLKKQKTDAFFEAVHKTMASYKTMGDHGIDSLDQPDANVSWHYNMQYHFTKDKIYFNPILHERISTNPFNSPERHYPVEMPYCIDYSYQINMETPNNYHIDELPKQERVLLGSGRIGHFEYLVKVNGIHIQVNYHFVLNKSWFAADDYQGLRDFYAHKVKKEQEEFVFKKN